MTTTTPTLTALLAQLSPHNKQKGDQFELLAKWWLENDPIYGKKFVKVWHFNKSPYRWNKGKDLGTDLIAKDVDGKIWAIQAKAYDESYYISKADLDSFLNDSEREVVDFRLLIATTEKLGPNAITTLNDKADSPKPVIRVMRKHLDKSGVNWPVSITDLYARQPDPYQPRDYQIDAINAVVDGFTKADRGQLIMVSATGKTLTGLFIAEKLGAKNILVLLPSLMLEKQTLKVWRRNATMNFKDLPVGSDASANKFGPDVLPSEMGYPVTTDAEKIADFLRQEGVKVVFSTYQSSRKIAKAQAMKGVPAFDLVIADEAHNTTGSLTSYFATVLHDEKINAQWRLFMTATPRNFTQRVKDAAIERGDEKASMDDEKRYGEVFYELPYVKALELKLVTDYKVAIITVTKGELREWADESQLVKLDGEETDLRKLAGQVAVLKAMRKYDLHRIITYHRLVEGAKDFAKELPWALTYLPENERPSGELWAEHIHGAMSTNERDLRMDQLAESDDGKRKVLANAKVLTEGVDVPALDGIAILDPKRSAIDIYQAQGRAIRLDPSKTHPEDAVAITILPVFVDPDEGQDEFTIESSAWSVVWNELKAMRDYDERFAEWVNGWRVKKGPPGLGSVPTIPPMVDEDIWETLGEDFANSFALKLVEMLILPFEKWFELLTEYVAEHDHARVPQDYVVDGKKLGGAVATIRSSHRRGSLSPEHGAQLLTLKGWVWDAIEAQWLDHYVEVKHYGDEHGHLRGMDKKYASWIIIQRRIYRENKMSYKHIELLEGVTGWAWTPHAARWEENFAQVKRHTDEHGSLKGLPLALNQWKNNQRQVFKDDLESEKAQRLAKLPGWMWDGNEERWVEGLDQAKELAGQVGVNTIKATAKLGVYPVGKWLSTQRHYLKKGDPTLTTERIQRLDKELPGWREAPSRKKVA